MKMPTYKGKDPVFIYENQLIYLIQQSYEKNMHKYLSTLHLKEHKLELSNSGTMSILCKKQ
jgi:hypothetical protein